MWLCYDSFTTTCGFAMIPLPPHVALPWFLYHHMWLCYNSFTTTCGFAMISLPQHVALLWFLYHHMWLCCNPFTTTYTVQVYFTETAVSGRNQFLKAPVTQYLSVIYIYQAQNNHFNFSNQFTPKLSKLKNCNWDRYQMWLNIITIY